MQPFGEHMNSTAKMRSIVPFGGKHKKSRQKDLCTRHMLCWDQWDEYVVSYLVKSKLM